MLSLCIAAAIWAVGLLGALSPLEGFLYDLCLRSSVALRRPQSRVLLVEIRGGAPAAQECLEMIRILNELGAENILVIPVPSDASERFYQAAAETNGLVFGRRLVEDPLEADSWRLSPVPRNAEGSSVEFAVVHVDPGVRGTYRRQSAWFRVGTELHPSIEASVLSPAEIRRVLGLDQSYFVDFVGGPGSLPSVEMDMVLGGQLIPELVQGRSAVVGIASEGPGEGLSTPVTKDDRKMTTLEYHGHALNTLLTGRVRRPTGALATLVLLLCLAAGTRVLYQWTDVFVGTWSTAGILIWTAALTGVVFHVGDTWLPVTEVLVSQTTLFVAAMRGKARVAGSQLRALLMSASSRLREKYLSLGFNIDSECWPLIVNMINQTLDLTRLIFLESEQGTKLLREVKALNCSIDDINERRRDFHRAPYLTAVEANGPIRVEGYLKKAFDREEQYLVPLVFGGEILGFWACGVEPAKAGNVKVFENVLRDYASLISEVLYEKRQSERRRSWLWKAEAFVTHEKYEQIYEQLKTTMEILEGRLRQIEGLLTDINTATVVYDLFGRVLHINDRMLELLEKEGLNPQKMTALDLLAALSEYDLSRSRRLLRRVIIDQQVIALPVRLSARRESRYVMHLHPLQVRTTEQGGDAIQELSGKSILCELVDTTAFTGLFEMKEKLTRRLGLQLRNDLASIELSLSLLESETLSGDQRRHISRIVREKTSSTLNVLVECQQYLSLDSEQQNVERFPVDAQEAFRGALLDLRSALARRNIRVEVEEPSVMSFVLASAESLRAVFGTLLKVLAGDATDGSTIQVEVVEQEDLVTYRFRNVGFGIPNERFREYIFGDATLATEDMKALREGISWVEAWGGELDASSEVGIGTTAVLRLVKFI